jgi:hypothetical protein
MGIAMSVSWASLVVSAVLAGRHCTADMRVEVRDLEPSPAPAKAGILRRILAFLATVLASPKGDRGGWEGGARRL